MLEETYMLQSYKGYNHEAMGACRNEMSVCRQSKIGQVDS